MPGSAQDKVPVTVLIPIKNEAVNLPRCLSSVTWADEIFVVDSASTDDSVAIAESFGARVFQFHFNGIWPKKKNWALDHLPFKHDWVFILDADEVLAPDAQSEFRQVCKPCDPATDIVGYGINRRFMFMGKWLKHSYYPNWNLRLFIHRFGRYEKLIDQPTASGDNEVHEHIVINGRTGHLKTEMDHYAFPSVDVFVEKHNRYSNWESRFALNKKAIMGDGHHQRQAQKQLLPQTRLKRHVKLLAQRLPCRPLLRFLYVYIWQKGFLDGMEGYYFARLHGLYEFLTIAKTHELQLQQRVSDQPAGTRD